MDLNTARDKVLLESIAQTVYKHLRDIHNNRQEYADRWIWELLQNARDTAKDDGATVEAARTDHSFSFRHDGAPFVDDEVAHLVYHGSSKDDRASSAEPIGRFGSGFLTTHILAGTITIRGLLKDGDNLLGFHFPLNRGGASADDLIAAMDGSWKAFNDYSQEVLGLVSADSVCITAHTEVIEFSLATIGGSAPVVSTNAVLWRALGPPDDVPLFFEFFKINLRGPNRTGDPPDTPLGHCFAGWTGSAAHSLGLRGLTFPCQPVRGAFLRSSL